MPKRPPKKWWDKMEKDVKKGNPDYSQDQVNKTIGDIWYNELSQSKRDEVLSSEGSLKQALRMLKAQRWPDDYTISIPEYAGDSHYSELLDLMSYVYSGQADPLYAVMSRRSNEQITFEELDAINDALDDYLSGKFVVDDDDEAYDADIQVVEDWKPVIEQLIAEHEPAYSDRVEKEIEEEQARKREIYDRYHRR